MISKIFFYAKYDVVMSTNTGLELVKKYKNIMSSIDLITMEIVLPQLNGIKTANEIYKINPKAKIIFISSVIEPEIINYAMLKGTKYFIGKPLNKGVLLNAAKIVVEGGDMIDTFSSPN